MRNPCSVLIVLPTFNGAEFIEEQLDSVLGQVPANCTVVVSDDGSSDETVAKVRSRKDDRIVLVSGPACGVAKNIESVLFSYSADFIFLCDQDDVWLPQKIPKMLEALKESDLVLCDAEVVDVGLNTISNSLQHSRFFKRGLLSNLYRNRYVGCCMAFRKEVLADVLPFPNNVPMHDWWIGLICEVKYQITFLDEPLVLLRRHHHNHSTVGSKSTQGYAKRIAWRGAIFGALLARLFKNNWKSNS